MHATGTFDVKLTPQTAHDHADAGTLGRLWIDKQFHGDLAAQSVGEMIAAGSAVEGSAAYSAVENVRGTLGGRSGSFSLQHTGIMNRGAASLTITVVPDSGTGGLAGLAGVMSITNTDGQHGYAFEYSLPS